MHWNELPAWRHNNNGIHDGYRQTEPSYYHSFRSLFYIHNQSVNIWSHIIGAIAVVTCSACFFYSVYPRYDTATPSDLYAFACFGGGAALCLGTSATFHAILDHSQAVARWGNKMDYTGIVALIVGSHVPALHYGFSCKPNMRVSYLSTVCVLGIGCIAASWIEQFRTPQWRSYRAIMFICFGLFGCIPVLHGVVMYGYKGLGDRMSVTWVILQGALYILGAVFYATRYPESVFPGRFDIWGNSHQIFHIFVLGAVLTHFYGMTKAFDSYHSGLWPRCDLTE